MDYDATNIALAYDRGRDHGVELLDLWMKVISTHAKDQPLKVILDLGCGTGRFTEALAAHFDAEVIGVDPSQKMLEQARSKHRDPRVRYASGRGESIPLTDNSVDLIFMSMSFHHFENPALAASECHRVLRHGGKAFLRTGTRERISSYPYVDFFPESLPILEEVLPSNSFLSQVFTSAGFRVAKFDLVTQQIAQDYLAYADKLAVGADSVLVRLSTQEFDAGLSAMREHAKQSGDRAVVEPIDVFVFEKSRLA